MQYTINSILNYIKRKETSYAILLNGKWGNGKTFFWKNILKKKIEENGKKTIYVSLYGVSNTEEIDKKIVLDRLRFGKKIAKNKIGGGVTELGKVAFSVLKKYDFTGVSNELENINYKDFFNYTNTVLCFDDLERVNMSIEEVLGYINNFVEHDGIKVIIIGNEEEITEKLNDQNRELKMLTAYFYSKKAEDLNSDKMQKSKNTKILVEDLRKNQLGDLFNKKNQYKRIKEKLIGKTLNIQLDEANIIGNILVQFSSAKLHSFLEHNIEIIESIFKVSENHNIRILKQALEDFEIIYNECLKNKYKSEVLHRLILKFVLAVSFEIKENKLGNEEFKEINSNGEFLERIGLKGIVNKKKSQYFSEFVDKYYRVQDKYYSGSYFFKFAEQLIRYGVFDLELFKNEIDKCQLDMNQKGSSPEELFFINFQELTDEDFIKNEQFAYKKLIDGQADIMLYYQAFQVYRYFVNSEMVEGDIADIKRELLAGLEKAGINGRDTKGLKFIYSKEKEDKDLLEFKEKILKIKNDLELKKKKENFNFLLEQMQINFYKFDYEINTGYLHEPFFAYFNIEEFSENVIKLSAINIRSIKDFMEKRIKVLEGFSFLGEEVQQVKLLKKLLIREIKNNKRKTPRLVALQELVDVLRAFENKVSAIQK